MVENKLTKQNSYFGRTQKMTSVIFTSEFCKPGDLIDVLITSSNQNNLFGKYKTESFRLA